MIVFLIASPWIAASAWVAYRLGWEHLSSDDGREFPSQASRLRAFSGS